MYTSDDDAHMLGVKDNKYISLLKDKYPKLIKKINIELFKHNSHFVLIEFTPLATIWYINR